MIVLFDTVGGELLAVGAANRVFIAQASLAQAPQPADGFFV